MSESTGTTEPAETARPPAEEDELTVEDVGAVVHTWLDCDVENLQYELPSGKMATDIFVDEDSISFRASEKFGDGLEPYADNPDTHREYLQSEDVVETDGVVVYVFEDGELELPRTIYFQETIEFTEPITETTASGIAARLETEINSLNQIDRQVSVRAPSSI